MMGQTEMIFWSNIGDFWVTVSLNYRGRRIQNWVIPTQILEKSCFFWYLEDDSDIDTKVNIATYFR